MSGLLARAVVFGRMIKFSHSIFALPFALTSAALAAGRRVPWAELPWILLAMVGARSAAMGMNRLADQEYDARNPRTSGRELPSGRLSRGAAWLFVVAATVAFVLAAGMLNPLCLALSPLALAIVFGYSYTKRFTALSHLFLGLALAVAPVGAWLAVRGSFARPPIVLGLAVLFWVAGFDTIYACQDVDFDRGAGLHSLPAWLGVGRALSMARVFHGACVGLLLALYFVADLHVSYLAAVAAVGGLLVYEHTLVRADDLSRVNAAFFAVNGWIAVLYFVATVTSHFLA